MKDIRNMEADNWKIYLEQQINKLAGIVMGNNIEKKGWAWNVKGVLEYRAE